GGESDGEPLLIEIREVPGAGEIFGRAAVDLRADELLEGMVLLVGALGRGGESQPQRCVRALGDLPVGWSRQMVALIEDEQAEALQQFGVQLGGLVGDNGDRADLSRAAAIDGDGVLCRAERRGQCTPPLTEQVYRGNDD